MSTTLDRWFDELAAGDSFETRGRTVTEADLVGFATLTGDMHPQHTDRAWSAESRFGERIAHGMLVLSYAVGLLPFDPDRIVALRGLDGVVFKRPVRIGETISVEGDVRDLAELDGGHGLVTTALTVRNERGEVVARARLKVVWRRRLDPADDPVDTLAATAGSLVPIPL